MHDDVHDEFEIDLEGAPDGDSSFELPELDGEPEWEEEPGWEEEPDYGEPFEDEHDYGDEEDSP